VLERANIKNVSDEVRRRRWIYISHTLSKSNNNDFLIAWKEKGNVEDQRSPGDEPMK